MGNFNKKIEDLTVCEYQEIIKQAFLEALFEFEEYKKKRRSKRNPDLISTRDAINLVGKARFYVLVKEAPLKRESTGNAPNSTQYVSKTELIKWNNKHP
ncbi:hypothetical protein [Dysgonomonas capnocytophagoides]|uniref:hypothetical protein n=1 Tax=Dysgonomonas capnocytophagoides TaxID=45254 RepID=UPI002A83B6DC|nr:hypothetical protein [Dysgonomonas capnocytophagoides]